MALSPDDLVTAFSDRIVAESPEGSVLDLACGDGRNGLSLAAKGRSVVLADRSEEALSKAEEAARGLQEKVTIWRVDLERPGENPLGRKVMVAMMMASMIPKSPSMPRLIADTKLCPVPVWTGSGSRIVIVMVERSILLSSYFSLPSSRFSSVWIRSICCWTAMISLIFVAFFIST